MTELLVGTRKGLFVLEGEPGAGFGLTTRAFVGDPVDYAMRDPRTGRLFAAVTSPFWGPRIWFTDGAPGNGDWEPARGVSLPKGGADALKRVWVIVAGEAPGQLFAGGDPGVLFESRDDGATWELNQALWEDPTRPRWRRDSGGLSVHSIVPWPGEPDRLALAISAAGVWLTEDGGATWSHGNEGIVADYLPEQARATAIDLCVHHLERAPPHDFGFPVTLDPADPDSAYVIPVTTSDRVTDGRVVVWETRDAGASWIPRDDGLPQDDAFLSVLRQSFAATGSGPALELYFGATSGEIFGSGDAGRHWFGVAHRLPAIASVRAA
jgi:hypothetical protein